MDTTCTIRLITQHDVAAALEIYRHYVLTTAITFEYDVPTEAEFLQRITTNTVDYPWLVCVDNNNIVGYAYGSRHRYKTAYQWSPESTIYLSAEAQGRGIGRVLYETLFAILKLQGYFNVYAGVALPNDKSERLHRAFGFAEIGDFKKIGYKLGQWHDVRWFQLHLAEHVDSPPPPKTMREIIDSEDFSRILSTANERLHPTS